MPRKRKSAPAREQAVSQPTPIDGLIDDQSVSASAPPFPIVSIGASAGGLEACTQFLERLPVDTGMAFVLVQHLAPQHESLLTELLARSTKMPVRQVKDGMAVEANHLYVIPPNTNMVIHRGILGLLPRQKVLGQHMPIDCFLRSLAEDQGHKAIGIILSGAASDGALGIEAIKAGGGITFAQEEASAKYPGMPRSAIATGYVDFILPPDAMAKELASISRHPYVAMPAKPFETEEPAPAKDETLRHIFRLLRSASGVDFTHYKPSTLKRRIARRMAIHKLHALADYARYLKDHPPEAQALFQELLIMVTSFFREPETFAALATTVFPRLLQDRAANDPIRIWVPGCSTGEEVYSIAICLLEYLGDRAATIPINLFATDIGDAALEKARAGVYIENIALDVSPERLQRFFVKKEHGYQVSKAIRELCVFAKQNLIKDPPFSRLDLISCRNVLIYLGPVLQKKVMPIFHYALKPTGFLMLGTSETIGAFPDLFTLIDQKHKLYAKQAGRAPVRVDFDTSYYESPDILPADRSHPPADEEIPNELEFQKEADRIALAKYAPVSVLINNRLEVVQFRGATSPYFEHPSGRANLNVLKMARPGLLGELRTLLDQARQDGAAVRKEGIQVKGPRGMSTVTVRVNPIRVPPASLQYYLVCFEETTQAASRAKVQTRAPQTPDAQARRIMTLEQELEATKAYLQRTIEVQEATNEELKSANEEILSSNEELQSTNEELVTAKEELQSTNEELITVNEELQRRNLELSQSNNDFTNLLTSANLAVVMLGEDLRIRRFTPMAAKLLNLIGTDLGRPISDLKPNFDMSDLRPMVMEVIDTVTVKAREIRDHAGRWYEMRIYPYKTADRKIDGAVIAWLDVDALKSALDYAETVVRCVPEPLLVLDAGLRIKTANEAFCQAFHVVKEETNGRLIYDLGSGQWNIPALRRFLEEIIPQNTRLENFEVEHEFPHIGRRTMLLNARRMASQERGDSLIILAIRDISEQRRADAQIKTSLQEKEVLLKEIHHRVKNNLQIISSLLNMQADEIQDPQALRKFTDSQHRIRSMALIHEKLYQSKDLAHVDMEVYIQSLANSFYESYKLPTNAITMTVDVEDVSLTIDTAIPCGLILNELLSNVFKHAFPAGRSGDVIIRMAADAQKRLTLIVRDTGIGLPVEVDIHNTESLGLRIVKALADQLDSTLQCDRAHGTTFTMTFAEMSRAPRAMEGTTHEVICDSDRGR